MSEMCYNCRYWQELSWIEDESKPKAIFGKCNHCMVWDGRSNSSRDDGVVEIDDGGSSGLFITGPAFKCKHYKE